MTQSKLADPVCRVSYDFGLLSLSHASAIESGLHECQPKKYRVGVVVSGENTVTWNALRFDTFEEAERYGDDLYARWPAVTAIRIEEVPA